MSKAYEVGQKCTYSGPDCCVKRLVQTVSSEDTASAWGFILMLLSITLGLIVAFVGGNPVFTLVLILLGVFSFVFMTLTPDLFPESHQLKRRKPSRIPGPERARWKVGVSMLSVTILFLVVLYWMFQLQLIQANEAIVIAVFTIIFQVVFYAVVELVARK